MPIYHSLFRNLIGQLAAFKCYSLREEEISRWRIAHLRRFLCSRLCQSLSTERLFLNTFSAMMTRYCLLWAISCCNRWTSSTHFWVLSRKLWTCSRKPSRAWFRWIKSLTRWLKHSLKIRYRRCGESIAMKHWSHCQAGSWTSNKGYNFWDLGWLRLRMLTGSAASSFLKDYWLPFCKLTLARLKYLLIPLPSSSRSWTWTSRN